MSLILKEKITGPAAWIGSDLAGDEAWQHRLSARALETIDAALAGLRARDLAFPNFAREDFPLPGLEDQLAAFADTLENGRGFLLLRGLPVTRYDEVEIGAICYGIGLNLGVPVKQNPRGDLLGEVINVGDPDDRETRVYQTNAYLPYHSDPSDVVGLLCLRRAKSGGVSSLVSAASVYNRLLENHPEHLGVFYRAFYYAHMGEDLPSLTPVFSYHDAKLSCRYLRQYIELGHEIMGHALTRVEREALDIFDAVTREPDLRLDMMLEPGDLQFANNYAILHSRSGFEDYADDARRRKMLRLWLKMPNARKLAPDFPGRNGFSGLDD